MRKRPWTTEDDDDLRRLYAQGWSDTTLGAMLNRDHCVIGRRRRMAGLGPAHGTPGSKKGWKHSKASLRKISKANSLRWKDPQFREKMAQDTEHLVKAREASIEARRAKSCAGYKHGWLARYRKSKQQTTRYKNDPAYQERMKRMWEVAKARRTALLKACLKNVLCRARKNGYVRRQQYKRLCRHYGVERTQELLQNIAIVGKPRFQRPAARKEYEKLRDILGVKKARQLVKEGAL